jgi:hypothetical protein
MLTRSLRIVRDETQLTVYAAELTDFRTWEADSFPQLQCLTYAAVYASKNVYGGIGKQITAVKSSRPKT